MGRSSALYQLQVLDSGLDTAQKRIREIEIQLQDRSAVDKAEEIHQALTTIHLAQSKSLKDAEHEVSLQNTKLDQNQKKLYSGAVSNPKELEDLQLESESLAKYLQVLEERQLQAMLEADQSQADLTAASDQLNETTRSLEINQGTLKDEKSRLEEEIASLTSQKNAYLAQENLPDLPKYESIRKSSGGLAVTLMKDASCASCGVNIPSAIEQTAKSPTKLAFCPTCNRILHPD